MSKFKLRRIISMLLVMCLVIGTLPTTVFAAGMIGSDEYPATVPAWPDDLPDQNKHAELAAQYIQDNNSQLLGDRTNLLLYFADDQRILAEGTTNEPPTQGSAFVPDPGRPLIIDFAHYQTQPTRIELCDSQGRYLGLIAAGNSIGQGDASDGWQTAINNISNLIDWDGTYYDSELQRYMFPGEDKDDGTLPVGEFSFIIAFQPFGEFNRQYRGQMMITIDYSESARQDLMQYVTEKNIYFGEVPCYSDDPVYMVTGNFTWSYTDISVHGAQPLQFKRYYNAQDGANGEIGYGWRHEYMATLNKTNSYIEITMPYGYKYTYIKKGDGSFSAPANVKHSLVANGNGYLFTLQDKTQYAFDSNGYLSSVTDVNGNVISITRNGSEIASVSNESGSLTFSYANGLISAIADQTGRTVSYSYDGAGDLVSFQNADEDTIDYSYDGSHRITEISDFNGNTYVENTYDSLGRVIEQYLADQGTSMFTYDAIQRISSITDPKGATKTYYYDQNQNVTRIVDEAGQAQYSYENGLLMSVTDRLDNSTLYEYDSMGNRTKITYPDGTTELFEYNSLNLITKKTNKDGSTLLLDYDAVGNLISYIDARGNEIVFTYDSSNNMLTSTDAEGNTTEFTYDNKGNALTQKDPMGNVTYFFYDAQGRLARQINPDTPYDPANPDDSVFSVKYIYSDAGKLVKSIDHDGNETEYDVTGNGFTQGQTDPLGNSISTEYNDQNKPIKVTDAMGNVTEYSYDSSGNLATTISVLVNEDGTQTRYTTSYTYDLAGRMTSMTDARGNTWRYVYDNEGHMTLMTPPVGGASSNTYDDMGRTTSTTQFGEIGDIDDQITSYEYNDMGKATKVIDALTWFTQNVYDENGNLIEQHDKNGNVWYYEYDKNNRLVKAADPIGYVTTYEYDANGHATKTVLFDQINNASIVASLSVYDNMGRIWKSYDAENNESVYSYDSLGRLKKTTFADGTYIENFYNANGWLTKSIAPDGGETSYTYNANGQVLTITDAEEGVTTYKYDSLGRTTSVTDALGGVTSYEYDQNGNLLSKTDALDGVTSYKYDALNRVTEVTDPNGGITLTDYDAFGNVSKVTSADGGVITYAYDKLNRLTSYTVVNPDGDADTNDDVTSSYVYDKNGNTIASTDGNGNTSETEYDGLNRAVKIIDPLDNAVETIYDAYGRVSEKINAEGAHTWYTYDDNGNVIEVKDALGNETIFTYDSMNRVKTMTDARGAVTEYTYTSTGKVETATDALGGIVSYEYDLLDRVVKETNELGKSTEYTYDALGRVLSVTNPLGNTESFTYDVLGRIKTATDKNSNVTEYIYDANGNIIETIDALDHSSYFEYDAMNRLVKVTLWRDDTQDNVHEQQVTLYSYDKRGLVTKEINAAGFETIYVYDGNGNMIQKTDADGYITEFSYDPRNLVELINYTGGKEVQFAYNANGELIAMMDWNGTVNFALDLLGRITSVNDHNEKITTYTYDSVGNQTSIKYPDNTTARYTYDLLGRLTNLKDAENQNTIYAYDAASQLLSQQYPNGWKDTHTYDAAGQKTGTVATDPTNTPSKTITHATIYDAQGNVINETRSGAGGQSAYNLTHTYDALNQLTQTTGTEGYKAHTYTYDSLGNLTYELVHNKGTDYKYNNLNQQVQKGSETFTFDKRGNLIKGMSGNTVTEQYTYDATNRMVKGVNDKGEQSHYIYNGFGYLVGNEWIIQKNSYGYTGVSASPKEQVGGVVVCDRHSNTTGNGHINPTGKGHTTGGTTGGNTPTIDNKKFQVVHKDYVLDYTSDLKDVIMETESGAGGLTYRYVYGLEKVEAVIYGIANGAGSVMQYVYDDGTGEWGLAGSVPSGVTISNSIVKLYYHHDRLGTTDYITDNVAGKVISYITYDDWGMPTAKGKIKCGVRELDLVTEYTGHPYDQVLGLYFAEARMYDAADRRFMAPDPAKESANLYSYCQNNPLINTDPTGAVITPANVIGGLIGAGLGYLIGEAICNYFELTGCVRWFVLGATSALVGVAGWFAGPAIYAAVKPVVVAAIQAGTLIINKATQWILDTLGIVTQKLASSSLVSNMETLYNKYVGHIFSSDHVSKGIMNLGKDQIDIFNRFINIINQNTSKIVSGSNEIRTIINGFETTIKFYVQDGKIISIDGFIGFSSRVIGNLINLVK